MKSLLKSATISVILILIISFAICTVATAGGNTRTIPAIVKVSSTAYGDFFSSYELREIQIMNMDSPPVPLMAFQRGTVDILPQSAVMISGVPTSEWTYGCSATSAGMIFGYYDRVGLPNMYTGPANGGVAPLSDLGQGIGTPIPGSCSIIATQNNFDGRTIKGHVDDYWTGVGNPGPDPWEGHWTEHTWGECTADYMGTNQWKWDYDLDGTRETNEDGSTIIFFYNNGEKLYDFTPPPQYGTPQTELCHGMRLFTQSRGYTVQENYTQQIDAVISGGFSLDDYRTEINNGFPVMIQLEGHSMVGVGYDSASQIIYIHDTWDNSVHPMTWGGSYTGMSHWGVTVIHLNISLPGQATNPNPANGATRVNIDADLSWTAGSDALSHNVYFGTTNPPAFCGNQTSTTYDPGTMSNSTTYYWRIDEKNLGGTKTGAVWSFTTVPLQRSLTTSASEGGTVTTPGIGTYWYDFGSNADINASPTNTNYDFVAWTGSAVAAGKVANPNSPSTTVLMDANYTVQAKFVNNRFRHGWTQRYNGSTNKADYVEDIAIDSANKVYVTGSVKNATTNYDIVTVKYTPDGNTVWTKAYNYPGSYGNFAYAMAIDANSDIIVVGCITPLNIGCDGIIIKYTSAGNQQWVKTYNSPDNAYDMFYDVAADAAGNIYAVGRSDPNCLIVKYTPDGNFVWARAYSGSANSYASLYQLALDANGDVYACGELEDVDTYYDALIVKYLPDGTSPWAHTYNGEDNGYDTFEAIAVDSTGNIYAAGSVETETDSNYITVKYLPEGDSLWTAFYTGTPAGWDEAYAIATTPDGGVVVTGYSQGETSSDAATVKYDSLTGNHLWAARYNGMANSTDYADAIAVDKISGRIYVLGTCTVSNSLDYLTICYTPSGTEWWATNYDGPASGTDMGKAIAVTGNTVYVTGDSTGINCNYDYATINYLTMPGNSCSAPPAGDLNGDCRVDLSDFTQMATSYDGSAETWLALRNIAETWLECGMDNPADCWQ